MQRPVLVFDDACGFCTWWAELIEAHSEIHTVGFSTLSGEQRACLPAEYEQCVHLLTENRMYSCGAAVETALYRLEFVPGGLEHTGPVRRSQAYRRLREAVYQWVTRHRGQLGRIVSRPPPARTNTD